MSDVRADGGVGTRLGLCACVVGSFRSWCPRSWFCSRLRPVHVSVHVSVHVLIYALDHGFFLSFFVERYLSIIHYPPLRRSLSHLSRLPFSFSLSMYAFPRFSDSLAKAICSSTRPAIYVQPRYACMYSIRIAYLYPPSPLRMEIRTMFDIVAAVALCNREACARMTGACSAQLLAPRPQSQWSPYTVHSLNFLLLHSPSSGRRSDAQDKPSTPRCPKIEGSRRVS